MNLSQSIKDFSQSTDASDRIFFLRCLKTLYETGIEFSSISEDVQRVINNKIGNFLKNNAVS